VIPSSVQQIGPSCFCPSDSLQEVIFAPHSRLTEIEDQAFAETGVEKIVVNTDEDNIVTFRSPGCQVFIRQESETCCHVA
jgi:hypothetical protein